jgi:hypothetical protein
LAVSAHGTKKARYSTRVDLGGQQRVWVPVRFSVKQIVAAGDAGAEPWKSISRVQLHLSEHDYRHGTRLVFDVGEVSLVRLTAPVLAALDAPRHLLTPRRALAFDFDVMGTGAVAKGSHTVEAALEAAGGEVRAAARQDLSELPRMALPLLGIEPGGYQLRLAIVDAAGKTCSELSQPVTIHAGPLASAPK